LRDSWGRTPLSWAGEKGHVAIVKLLLAQDDVNVNSKDIRGCTPLSFAAREGHITTMRLLLEHPNVDVNSKEHVKQEVIGGALFQYSN
jgi:ankyrin repeat protein